MDSVASLARLGFFFSLREHITVTDELLTRPECLWTLQKRCQATHIMDVCVCVCLHDPECVSVGACVSASAHASLVCMYVCVMGSFPAAGSVGTP